jgi:hypothetical protein
MPLRGPRFWLYRPVIYQLACKRGLQDADADDLACSWFISATEALTPVPRVLRFAGVFV